MRMIQMNATNMHRQQEDLSGVGGTVHGTGASLCEDVDCSSLVKGKKIECVGGGARCGWVGRRETSTELMLTAIN